MRRFHWFLIIGLLATLLIPTTGHAQCRIYYTESSLDRARLHGEKSLGLVAQNEITALGIDEQTGEYLWAVNSTSTDYISALYRAGFNSGTGTRIPATEIRGAVDSITYASDQSSIYYRVYNQVYRFDGTNAYPVFNTWIDPGSGGGVARDPVTGRFYLGGSWGISVTEADGSGGSTVPGVPTNVFPATVLFNPADGLLYYVTYLGDVYRIDKNGGTPQLVTTQVYPTGLTADFSGNYLYWIDFAGTSLKRSNLDGSGITTLHAGLSRIERIAVGKTAGRIAFASDYEIFSVALDGSDLKTINSIPTNAEDPMLDQLNERLYFISKLGKAIFRTAVDGSGLERIVFDLSMPEGLALDVPGGYLYWGDAEAGTISRARLDGTDQTILLSGAGSITDIALDRVHNKIYWSETNSGIGKIRESSLSTPSITERFSNLGAIAALDVDDNTETIFWSERVDDSYIKRWRPGDGQEQIIVTLPTYKYPYHAGELIYPATALDIKFSEDLGKLFWSKIYNVTNLSVFESSDPDGSHRTRLVPFRQPGYREFSIASSAIGSCGIGYDDDELVDLTVFRPSTGVWFIKSGSGANLSRQWGLPGDLPVQGDFDGDGKLDMSVWRPVSGNWHVCTSASGFDCAKGTATQFGIKGDYPFAADIDLDRKDDFIVWRPFGPGVEGQWFIRHSISNYISGPVTSTQWGLRGDIPLLADFNGEGVPDLTVWRPSNGTWYILPTEHDPVSSAEPPIIKQWGLPGDHPMAGDYDGDGRGDLVVWRPSNGTWYICGSKKEFDCSQGYSIQFGLPGDHPITADFDGDSILDFAVWRPSLPPVVGQWYYKRSSDGLVLTEQWGLKNDIPLGLGSKSLRTFFQ